MCYNKEVSFVVALFGILCAAKEFKKKDIVSVLRGVYMMCLVIMQINEFFLHCFNKPSTFSHQLSAYFISVTIGMQIVALLITGIILPTLDKNLSITVIVTSSIFLACLVYFTAVQFLPALFKQKYNSTLLCKEGCRLKWDVANMCYNHSKLLTLLFTICYMTTLFITTYGLFGWELLTVLICLLLFSFVMSWFGNSKGYNYFGSLWCFSSVIVFSAVIIMD